MSVAPTAVTVRVWDLPTRLFHWALAVCVVATVSSGLIGGSWIEWHSRGGYAVLTLLLFRVAWGVVGGHWSRFGQWLYGPASVVAYLRGQATPAQRAGHSPIGGLAVLAMLLVLLAQAGTGLIADDEIAFTGPLNRFVSSATGLAATSYHKSYGQWLVIGLACLHLAAVLFYRFVRRDNLIRPMITGDKASSEAVPASRDDARSRALAAVLLAMASAAVAWIAGLGSG